MTQDKTIKLKALIEKLFDIAISDNDSFLETTLLSEEARLDAVKDIFVDESNFIFNIIKDRIKQINHSISNKFVVKYKEQKNQPIIHTCYSFEDATEFILENYDKSKNKRTAEFSIYNTKGHTLYSDDDLHKMLKEYYMIEVKGVSSCKSYSSSLSSACNLINCWSDLIGDNVLFRYDEFKNKDVVKKTKNGNTYLIKKCKL